MYQASHGSGSEDANRKVISAHLRWWIGSRVTSIGRVLPQSQVQLNVILHCFFAGERMHLVIACSFQFTVLPFGIATTPFKFVRVAQLSSVLRPLVIYCCRITYLLVGIEAITGLCTETTLGDKLMKSELIPTKHLLSPAGL